MPTTCSGAPTVRQRGADVLQTVSVTLLRADTHRHRDRDHPAQALRHRRDHQPGPGVRCAGRVHHRLSTSAIVVGIGAPSGSASPRSALSVLATAVVAVAFQPVRERLHGLANRLVYGSRATPYEVLSDFAAGMAGRTRPPSCCPGWRRRSRSAWAGPGSRSGCATAGTWRARSAGRQGRRAGGAVCAIAWMTSRSQRSALTGSCPSAITTSCSGCSR